MMVERKGKEGRGAAAVNVMMQPSLCPARCSFLARLSLSRNVMVHPSHDWAIRKGMNWGVDMDMVSLCLSALFPDHEWLGLGWEGSFLIYFL